MNLEGLASQLRSERGRFGNGSWKIVQFYESLGYIDEPEGMCSSTRIFTKIGDTAAAFNHSTRSLTQRPLTEYAWRARGSGFANTVTKERWRLFSERLAKAKELLDKSADFEPKCPVWWRKKRMTVARGQGWSWDDYENFSRMRKRSNPRFGVMMSLRPPTFTQMAFDSQENGIRSDLWRITGQMVLDWKHTRGSSTH